MSEDTNRKFEIFRASESPSLAESQIMSIAPFDDEQQAHIDKLLSAGYLEGDEEKLLFNVPGFSLVHVWFKKNYPLIRHTHDADCLYYIIAGSLDLGTETLGPRDGFFIPAGTPYTYRAGDEGVELLEFRHATRFNLVNLTKGHAFYDRALETVTANLTSWRSAKKPPLNVE